MTTEPPESTEPDPVPETPASTPPATTSVTNLPGETLVMVAGVIVVGVFLIFAIFANEWTPPFESVVVASFALIIPLAKVRSVGTVSGPTLMKLIGFWLAVAGAWDFVRDLRFGWGGAFGVIASLLLAASAVIAFFGARAIDV